MYFENLDGDTETQLLKWSKQRFSGHQETQHNYSCNSQHCDKQAVECEHIKEQK